MALTVPVSTHRKSVHKHELYVLVPAQADAAHHLAVLLPGENVGDYAASITAIANISTSELHPNMW